MNRGTLWIVLLAVVALGVAGCGNSHHVTITTAPTTLTAGASSNVVATVSHSGSAVNWTCLPAGACGSFNPTQTPNGGTSVYTAPPAAPSGGSVTIIATSVAHPSRSASVSVAITGVLSANFVFYASGIENCDGNCPYSVAGVVTIAQDGSGTVLGGEQDYNDGFDLNVPDDAITGGLLTLANDGSGNATLTITTASGLPGVDGTETFALNYANPNHALIIQFDSSATSSGSLDLQTSTAAPASASFAFVASGFADSGDELTEVDEGGVFAVDGSGNITGTFDRNLGGTVNTGQTIPSGSTVGSTDSLGRGMVTGITGADTNIAYYVVGPEVLRVIDIDPDGEAGGSSYGQGSAGFSSATLGASVFSIGSSFLGYAEVGQFNTSLDEGTARPKGPVREGVPPVCSGTGLCDFFGIDDQNFEGTSTPEQSIDGTYSIAANGYGSLTYDNAAFDSAQTFGIYAVDPNLNILDPNDTTDGLGGTLIAEMDDSFIGVGSIVPQSDPSAASFTGPYTFGMQGGSEGGEFDFIGSATVAAGPGALSNGTGALNDPVEVITDSIVLVPNATFTGTVVADTVNTGRYTIDPFGISDAADDFGTYELTATLYQAEGGQLFWIDMNEDTVGLGSWETQPAASSDARKAQAKTNIRKQ
jgi:hypothetical protein